MNSIFKASFRIITGLLCIWYSFTGFHDNINYVSNGSIILFSSLAPDILARLFKIKISSALDLFIQLFIFLALFLGRMYGFYSLIPYWDLILHLLSGFLIGALALAQINLIGNKDCYLKPSPLFICFYVIFTSTAIAAIWEFWEFFGDQVFGFDSQLGSLTDTMTDMMMGTISGIIIAFFAYGNTKSGKYKFLNGITKGLSKK